MTDQPTPLQFLQLLYKGAVTTGTVEFRLLPSRKQLWMVWPMFEGHPDEIKSFPVSQDVYFGVSLRRDNTDGGGKNLHPTHLVWIDIDLKGTVWTHGQTDVLNMTPEELRACAWAAFQHYIAAWIKEGLMPRAVVYTGHGLQVYWARRGRSDVTDTEAYNRGLAAAWGGDPKTIDAARIFRVPGSQNLKNKERPLPVELWHQDAEAWVEHDALEPYRMAEKPRPAAAPSLAGPVAAPQEGEGVIAQYNARWPITAVLERYGYQREDDRTYTRPGSDASGRDVKLLENARGVLCSYHHSSNDPVSGHPSDKHLREPFDLFTEYEHAGDFKAAVRAASAELGLGHQATGAGTIGKNKTATKVKPDANDPFKPAPSSGVYVKHSSYYIDRPVKKNGEIVDWIPEQLTNWIWEPELKLLYPDGSSAGRGTLRVLGEPHQIQLGSKAWNGRKDILEAVGGYEARAFTSSNSDIAKIGDYISTNFPNLPVAHGIKSYGLHQFEGEWVQVFEDQTISEREAPPLFYSGTPVDPGSRSFRSPRQGTEAQVDEARRAIAQLPGLITPATAYALLGYGAASAFSPRITPHLGNRLPFEYVAGERESGKTSGAQIVLELMTGYSVRLTKASGMSPYQYDIAHSAANNLLALLDEYRPGEIDDGQLRKHHDLGTKWRGSGIGGKDHAYELNAPTVVLGEGFTDDAATRSRGVLYFTHKQDRGDLGAYAQTLRLPLWAYAGHLHEQARLTSDVDHLARLEQAGKRADRALGSAANPRLRYALTYIAYGLLFLQEDTGVIPDSAIDTTLAKGVFNTLDGGTEGMTNLEMFLEQLCFALAKVPNPEAYVSPSVHGTLVLRPRMCVDLVIERYRERGAISNAKLFNQYAEQAPYFDKGETYKTPSGEVVRGRRIVLADIPPRCDADLLNEIERQLRPNPVGGHRE